ncbi:MAG: hypothetical protein WCQ47_01940 [bacterium]
MKVVLKLVVLFVMISGSINAQTTTLNQSVVEDQLTKDCEPFFYHWSLYEKGEVKAGSCNIYDLLISDIEQVLNNANSPKWYESVEFLLEYMAEYNTQLSDAQKDKLTIIAEKVKFKLSYSDKQRVDDANQFLEAYIGSKQTTVDAAVVEVLKIITNKDVRDCGGRDYLALEYLRTILADASCPKETVVKYQSLLNKIGEVSILAPTTYSLVDMKAKMEGIETVGKKLIKR